MRQLIGNSIPRGAAARAWGWKTGDFLQFSEFSATHATIQLPATWVSFEDAGGQSDA